MYPGYGGYSQPPPSYGYGAYPGAPPPYGGAPPASFGAPTPYAGAAPMPFPGAVAPGGAPAPAPGNPAPSRPTAATAPVVNPPTVSAKFPIKESDKLKYANIYSLIAAVEVLEDEYCNGNISSDDRNTAFKDLKAQFDKVKNAMGLGVKEVTNFCKAARLQHVYAISALFSNADEGEVSKTSLQQAVDLGTDFTTLSDLCFMQNMTGSQFQVLVRRIESRLKALQLLQNNTELRQMTTKWVEQFDSIGANDVVPATVTDQLKSDIQPWRMWALDAL